ncbi:MAG: helix-turn-helix domain-containing protein [Armatimonadetes bacterium]|nr:helix-turn-helix domain-containing protein [Armatimonadota bacterium]
MIENHEKLLLTIEEAAHLLGIGRTTAYTLVKEGEWRTLKIGRLRRISRSELDRWIQQKLGYLSES